MAQSSTQDNQKVFQSAIQGFKSFFGPVENPSSSKNMELIYGNMTKLFDTFTQGVLTGQGANSEILLRTVYRALNEDFLQIIQDTAATDKIVELLEQKQGNLTPETVDEALVSETTKKIITKTLDPNDCNLMDVALDFIDELQTAILQVKLNLSREYERQKLLRAKTYEGQQEDLDRLKNESSEQSEQTANTLEELQQSQTEWDEEQFKKTEKLLETFKVLEKDDSGTRYLKEVSTTISKDKEIQQLVLPRKYDPKKVLEKIKGVAKRQEEQLKQAQKALDEQKATKEQSRKEELKKGDVKPQKELTKQPEKEKEP